MKDFFSILRTYAWPYKGYLIGSLVFNLLSAVLNVFSFMSLMPYFCLPMLSMNSSRRLVMLTLLTDESKSSERIFI